MNMNTSRALLLPVLAAALPLAGAPAQAEEGRFYAGLAASAESMDIRYSKSVYESAAPRDIASDAAADDEDVSGFGALAGYRWPLGGGLFLSGEADYVAHGGTLRARLPGTGQNQGQVWPEDWSLKKDYSYGLTLRLGGSPGGSDLSLYALAGLRSIRAEFTIVQTGCPAAVAPCPPGPLAVSTFRHDRDFTAWTIGAGVEKPLGEDFALQLEARYADYDRKSWTRLFNQGEVVIPLALSGRETGVALRLLRYF